MRMLASVVGIVAAVAAIVFWGIFSFDNPYAPPQMDVIKNLFIAMVIPAIIAIIAQFVIRKWLMFIAFLLTLPISLYLAMTPGIFRWFGFVCAGYFISFVLLFFEDRGTKALR